MATPSSPPHVEFGELVVTAWLSLLVRVGVGVLKRKAAAVTQASFADRLNKLFDTVHPPGRKPHSNAEVAEALASAGHRISKPYISQLRSGHRTNPSNETVAALARFFKVKPDYFFDPMYEARVDRDLEVLAQLQGYGLRRLSARAFDLSEDSQNLLAAMAERLRTSEGLPAVPPDSTP